VTEVEFNSLLARGHETNGVEFKGRGSRSDSGFLAGVIKAILAMANRRDGGLVIIGVDANSLEPIGFDEDEAKAWMNYDELAANINRYASPSVSFDLEVPTFGERRFVIVVVHEFSEIPILCCQDFDAPRKKEKILRRGACYVRSRHKPETSEIPSEQEMRELLELAIDKGVRKFVERAKKAGLFPQVPAEAVAPTDEARFAKQIEEVE
jgi:predicted HTH transcriptional regulator